MECLKMITEINLMGSHLKLPFLEHFFSNYDPSKDRNLAASMTAFHLRDLESSDYRSAYVQLTDWFYGWNVSDVAEFGGTDAAQQGLDVTKAKRVPRSIDMASEVEKNEVDRIMKTFITLFAISRRTLRKYHLEIEEKMPRLGHGLDTFKVNKAVGDNNTNKNNQSQEQSEPFLDKEDIWLQNVENGTEDDEEDEDGDSDDSDESMDEKPDAVRKTKGRRGSLVLVRKRKDPAARRKSMAPGARRASSMKTGEIAKSPESQSQSTPASLEHQKSGDILSTSDSNTPQVIVEGDTTAQAPNPLPALAEEEEGKEETATRTETPTTPSMDQSKESGEASLSQSFPRSTAKSFPKPGEESTETSMEPSVSVASEAQTAPTTPLADSLNVSKLDASRGGKSTSPMSKTKSSTMQGRVSITGSKNEEGRSKPAVDLRNGSVVAFNFMTKVKPRKREILNSDMLQVLRADINHIYGDIDKSTDYALLCLSIGLLILAFAQLQEDQKTFTQYLTYIHEISSEFVSNTLTVVWSLLLQEIPEDELTLVDLRDTEKLRQCLKDIIEIRLATNPAVFGNSRFDDNIMDGVDTKSGNAILKEFPWMRLHRKFALAHRLMTAVDIHILPPFMYSHKTGVKCCQISIFDSNIWLTGGYDGLVRIHDFRTRNCLAQYAGHKSIVTDVCFTKSDSYIVSSSFDRTIRIWESQTANCERVLTGHTDFVTSCDVSPDGRHIISGSTDNTIKVWDFATGDCIHTLKKHNRWVKVVRFSPDGKYFATGGLDKKIFLWETKHVVNSKSMVTHSRCIEAHADYVLDLALGKQNLLLSASRDQTVKLFNYITGQELYTIRLAPSWARTVSFSGDMEYFATGSFDNNLLIFRTSNGQRVRQLRVFNMGILCVKWPGKMDGLDYVVCGTEEGFFQKILL